jgi:endonuclease/exonuclease/phosphatase family metal-dependent hydrolase
MRRVASAGLLPLLAPRLGAAVVELLVALLVALLVVACGGDDEARPRTPVKVMTRNLFLGGDVFGVVGDVLRNPTMTPALASLPPQVETFWKSVQASDPAGRMELVAQEIAEAAPDLVGLQEVELFRLQAASDFDPQRPSPNATEPAVDFLALLRAALDRRGARYAVALETPHTDVELPGIDAEGRRYDLRMTDRDVILVREGVETKNARGRSFDNRFEYRLDAVPIRVVRGYGLVEVAVRGARFTFGNSHLEVGGDLRLFQEAQARELAAVLRTVRGPLVLVGDFNSAADGPETTLSYAVLTERLRDAHRDLPAPPPSLTCCSGLRAATFAAEARIDLVLYRGPFRATATATVGTDPARRTAGGLWPSDHAGVVTTLDAEVASP